MSKYIFKKFISMTISLKKYSNFPDEEFFSSLLISK